MPSKLQLIINVYVINVFIHYCSCLISVSINCAQSVFCLVVTLFGILEIQYFLECNKLQSQTNENQWYF